MVDDTLYGRMIDYKGPSLFAWRILKTLKDNYFYPFCSLGSCCNTFGHKWFFFRNYFRCSKSSDPPSHNCFPTRNSNAMSDVEVNSERTQLLHYQYFVFHKCVVREFMVNDTPIFLSTD